MGKKLLHSPGDREGLEISVVPSRACALRTDLTGCTLGAAILGGIVYMFSDRSLATCAGIAVFVGACGAIMTTARLVRWSLPSILVSPEGLTLIEHGVRRGLKWNEIKRASHRTGMVFREWTIVGTGNTLCLRDTGLRFEGWTYLSRVIEEACHSAGVVPMCDLYYHLTE